MASGPRRLNWVTLLLILGVAAGGYWLWKFLPVYYTAWQVDTALSDGTAQAYRIAKLPAGPRSTAKAEIERSVAAKVVALGVTDPKMAVRIDFTEHDAVAECDYKVEVRHAIVDETKVMEMHRTAATDLKRPDW
jgi:hypothetical protein